ncbi:glutamate racemase, partial [Campylobacter jejuni]
KERENIDLKNHKAKLHFYASSDVESLKNTANIWLNL